MRRTVTLIACLALWLGVSVRMTSAASGTIQPDVFRTYVDNNGQPCASCLVFWYQAGTSTKQSAFSDVGLTTPLANPTTLNSSGRIAAGGPFYTPGQSYKVVLAPATDTDPPAAPIVTQDNVGAVPPTGTATDTDVTATAGEGISAGDAVYWSDGSGGATAGRVYRTDADNTYSSSTAQAIGFATAAITTGSTGTIRRGGRITGLSGLTAGVTYFASATAGALTSTAPANSRAILQADSTTAGVILTGEPVATSTLQGVIAIGAQTMGTGIKTFGSAVVLSGGATYASGTTISNEIFARSTADFTKNNNTTFGDVTGLSFAIGANETWIFQFVLHTITVTAAGIKFTLTGPAAPTATRYGLVLFGSSVVSDVAAFGSSAIWLNGPNGTDTNVLLSGIIRNGANAGTVQLQAAQNTADVSNTRIYAESYVIARRVQ